MSTRLEHSLLAARGERGWSQSRAAEAAGITRQSYAAIESGRAVPSTDVAMRLARALGWPMEELFRLPGGRAGRVDARWVGVGDALGRRVQLVRVGGRLMAYAVGQGQLAGRVAGVVEAGQGAEVSVALLQESPPPADLAVVGCDPAFGIVVDALRRERGIEVAWSLRGSLAALDAVAAGAAHIAGAHLSDPATGAGNGQWIAERIPFPCSRFRFAVWEQGLLVPRGNPAGIRGVEDLVRPGLRLVNREPGSGSRMLLEGALENAAISHASIEGFGTAARSHTAVGEAIAAGLADVGVGLRAVGAMSGLDLVPLRNELYELIVPDHFLDLPAVQALLDLLRRPAVRAQIGTLPGYDVVDMGLPSTDPVSGSARSAP